MMVEYPANTYDLVLNYLIIVLPNYYLSFYVFCKSQSIKLRVSQLIYTIVSGILFSAAFIVVRFYSSSYSNFLFFTLVPILMSFLITGYKSIFTTITIGLVSISLVFSLEVVSVFIYGTAGWFINLGPNVLLTYLFSKTITLILCISFMNIKRFRRGFQFFYEENNLGIGLALSSIVMVLKCLDLRENQGKIYMFVIFVIGIIIAGFGLYLWIRRSITELYRKRQQLKSEEHYKEILEERDREIEKLNQSNAYLAKVVHRDNHLMSSLNTSIDMYFNSDDEAYKENLLRELQTLSKERGEQINREQLESKLLSSTGNSLIDGAINDLYIKAAAHGIDFNLTVSSTVDEVIGKFISQTDLQTLLCDHIKDAIIAVESRGETGGRILVSLSKQNDNYCVDIYDSGVAFEPETLTKLGLERVTTHADSGGSGIGFMTTFETLRKAYASLIITEFENRTPFSKSVSFRFDGETAFIIKTYRKEELQPLTARDDMLLVS